MTVIDVDALAQEIRRVEGNHDKGAGALAKALMPFLERSISASPAGVVKRIEPTYTQAEYDDAYELGKRDGYSEAVQQIDQLTGGDGEYRYCSDHDPDRHTPGPAEMIQRIVDRFETLNLIDDASKTGRDQEWGMSAIEPAGVGVETASPYDTICAAVDEVVGRAEIEWSYREDNHRYPRDFWHAQISYGSFDSGWRSYGEQEKYNLPDDVKARAEAGLRAELRSHLLSPFASLKGDEQ